LYTPQRLFGEVGSSTDVLGHEPFLERARLQREQEHDGSARLALGAYVVARLVDRLLTLDQDPSAMQGFHWQLEAVRRHVMELPANSPEAAHLGGVVEAIPEDGQWTASLWMSLTAYAYFLEHDGRLEESLEIVTLAARCQAVHLGPSDFVLYALLAGRLNRQLTRWERATTCYEAAQEAAHSAGDTNRSLRACLGRAHVQRQCGNLPRARDEVEQVISEAASLGIRDVQSDAYQDLGVILMLQGLRSESLQATYEAFKLAEDPLNRMRVLGDLGYALNESGHYHAARVALEIVVASEASYLVKLNAILELMQLESALGNRVAFERRRQQARELSARMTPSMEIDFRYKTAVGLARFGQVARARETAAQAMGLAEQHRLNEWYFRLENLVKELDSETQSQELLQAPAETTATPSVVQIANGLQEYAFAAGV
jgi:tetratricopeptide (TPR) repeat protein